MHEAALIAHVRDTLRDLLARWREQHGVVVAELDVQSDGHGGAWVVGDVLVPSQRAALERSLASGLRVGGYEPDAARVRVRALTELDDAVWIAPRATHVDVHATPNGDLATQWSADEPPIRRLWPSAGWLAVELADRTVGWCEAASVTDLDPSADRPPSVAEWRDGWAGSARPADATDWLVALAPWLGSPYRLGGRLRSGIDCSALTQKVFRAAQGIGLPRHSSDQTRFGARVPRESWAMGDLLLLHHLERGVSHTALVLPPAPWVGAALVGLSEGHAPQDEPPRGTLSVAHAGLDHAAVVVEPMDDFLARYGLRAARRFPEGLRPLPRDTDAAPVSSGGEPGLGRVNGNPSGHTSS